MKMDYQAELDSLKGIDVKEQLRSIHLMLVDLDKRVRALEPLVYENVAF